MKVTFQDGLVLDARDVELKKSYERQKALEEQLQQIKNKKEIEYKQEKEYLDNLKRQKEINVGEVAFETKNVTDLQKTAKDIIEKRAKSLLKLNKIDVRFLQLLNVATFKDLFYSIPKRGQEMITETYKEQIPTIATAIIDLFDTRNDEQYEVETVVELKIKSNLKCFIAIGYYPNDVEYAYIPNSCQEADRLQNKIEQLEISLLDANRPDLLFLIHIYFQEYFSEYFFTRLSKEKELLIYIRTSEIYKIRRANEEM